MIQINQTLTTPLRWPLSAALSASVALAGCATSQSQTDTPKTVTSEPGTPGKDAKSDGDGAAKMAKASDEPYGIDEQVLESVIHHLVYLRNLCAHHSRLWNREATIGMKLAKRPAGLRRQFNPDRPKRIFNSLVMLGFLLDRISPGSGWRTRVVHLVAEHPELDLDAMGFVADWRGRLLAEPEG